MALGEAVRLARLDLLDLLARDNPLALACAAYALPSLRMLPAAVAAAPSVRVAV